jgi:hypothetical protein
MALLARFACGCTLRVEIPAPNEVRCERHGSLARLISTPKGQVRYVPVASTCTVSVRCRGPSNSQK